MKKGKFGWIAIIAISMLVVSCSPKTKKVTIENTKSLLISGIGKEKADGQITMSIVPDFVLLYDVEVSLNGVDFGTIEGGTSSETKDVPDANNLKVDKFNILKNEAGLSVYYKTQNGDKVYMDFTNEAFKKYEQMERCETDMSLMERKFRKVDQAGGLMNDSWRWDVSYGENGNRLANIAKEKAAKNKKKKK